ncbi:MAG: DUF6323 family protein [Clostridia bacterium]|nr:DUF6323 family protein [Clostridia bacterium]
MDNSFALEPAKMQKLAAIQELRECNKLTAKFGLTFSDTQIQNLVESRFSALRDTGRIEFGEGILQKLIYAFCPSPYLMQDNYEETLMELQDSFYYYKNESLDQFSDDELIEFMRKVFNGRAQGSVEYLAGSSLEELCRYAREDYDPRGGHSAGDLF